MANDKERKKIEVRAVINFCRANGMTTVNKNQIFEYFGVPPSTGNTWFPGKMFPSNGPPTEQAIAFKSSPVQPASNKESPPMKRQNPVRNGGRDRKRMQSIIKTLDDEDSTTSSPPPLDSPSSFESCASPGPAEPVTPSNRKIIEPKRKTQSRPGSQVKAEGEAEIKLEWQDNDDIEV